MAEDNKKIDEDILRCKEDVLKARSVKPAGNKTSSPPADSPSETPKKAGSTPSAPQPDPEPQPAKPTQLKQSIETQKDPEPARKAETSQIPKFDLAEEIMAEQRKLIAARRKAPSEKERPSQYPSQDNEPSPMEAESLIAEIVARDIKQMLKG